MVVRSIFSKMEISYFFLKHFHSTSTCGMGRPEFECVTSPLIHFDGASKVYFRVTWSFSFTALSPVNIIDLPQSCVDWAICIVVDGVCVSPTFMRYNALATLLIPTVLITPIGYVLHIFISSTVASRTLSTWTITATGIGTDQIHNDCEKQKSRVFHFLSEIDILLRKYWFNLMAVSLGLLDLFMKI